MASNAAIYLAVAAALLVHAPFLVDAAGTVLRGTLGPVTLSASSRQQRAQLPDECSHCQHGYVDPFGSTHDYCTENYDQCKCCKSALQNKKYEICTQGNNGGTFMGYGSCVDGIQAAIKRKEASCEHQQSVDDWNKRQREDEINDAMGDDSPYANHHTLVAVNSSSNSMATANLTYPQDRFHSECAAYSDPSCEDYKALCAYGYGCNKQLQKVESDYQQVKDYHGLWQNTPCYR